MSALLTKCVRLFGLLALIAFLAWCWKTRFEEPAAIHIAADATNRLSPELLQELAQLEARERRIAQTVWAKELLAQKCGRVFEQLWDNLNASSNKLQTLLSFPCDQLVLGQWEQIKHLAHGIEWRESKGQGKVLTSAEWRASLDQWQTEGWRLDRIEFRHTQFETDDAGKPRQSQFYFAAHLTNEPKETRSLIDGTFGVRWTLDALPRVKQIDASALALKTREGPPPFALVLSRDIPTGTRLTPIDPLMVCDLDLDGRSEIILAAANMVFRWGSAGRFESEPLIEQPLDWISSALLADFNADTRPDLLCARVEGLFLMRGSPDGKFIGPSERVWSPAPPLRNPMVMTCGDIDRDGDLDLFLAQYRHPYENGSMPTPFYNSNDGLPAYLLLNDGAGRFSDATIGSGLESKRKRRTFSSSFTDLDGDGDLDLVVVSDFAGVDLYQNDSRGHFNEVTREWVSEPHAFGMGHSLSDFNADGRLDLLMIGMTSPTVDRLEHLNLWRPDAIEDRTRRAAMVFGNRLYVARSGGGFEQTTLSESIARSGWSWGCSAFDWDNDGYPDVYIANGFESNRSVQEYEPEYWLHDRYVGQSQENPLAYLYFRNKFNKTRGRDFSYGGWEKNRLFWNQHGKAFLEIAHLMGLAVEQDCRNVLTDDFNGDGRMDLVVTTYELWPAPKQTLRIYQNNLTETGNWIGFRFREEGPGSSPIGLRMTVQSGKTQMVREIVTGDSYRSQHAPTVHFGLGTIDRIDQVLVRWPGGMTLTLTNPVLNSYHLLRPQNRATISR